MNIGDLVRHKDGRFGIVEWPYNKSSWWHRKNGLSKIAILLSDSGKTVWWSSKDIEVVCEAG